MEPLSANTSEAEGAVADVRGVVESDRGTEVEEFVVEPRAPTQHAVTTGFRTMRVTIR